MPRTQSNGPRCTIGSGQTSNNVRGKFECHNDPGVHALEIQNGSMHSICACHPGGRLHDRLPRPWPDEVTMRLRGSEQQFSGKLLSYDGNVYVLETQIFGEMRFDASRFECISVDCEKIANQLAAGTSPANEQAETVLSPDQQIELFKGFRDWNDFQTFLEWRKKNSPDE